MIMIQILQTPTFAKQIKKLHANQRKDLNLAVKTIIDDPEIGERKKGDLREVHVYKFKMIHQLTLLAYLYDNDALVLTLLSIGSHENFYRDLKK